MDETVIVRFQESRKIPQLKSIVHALKAGADSQSRAGYVSLVDDKLVWNTFASQKDSQEYLQASMWQGMPYTEAIRWEILSSGNILMSRDRINGHPFHQSPVHALFSTCNRLYVVQSLYSLQFHLKDVSKPLRNAIQVLQPMFPLLGSALGIDLSFSMGLWASICSSEIQLPCKP